MKIVFASDIELSVIKQIELRADARPDTISLAQGIPSFDTPSLIKEKVIESIKEGRAAKYSLAPGLVELRELLEETLAEENMHYDFEKEIIVTAGAIEAISATLLTVLQAEDEVLLTSPSYVSYFQVISLAKGRPVYVPLKEEEKWGLDIEAIKKAITRKTKVILLCNPNNPTGSIFTENELMRVGELAEKHNLLIIMDEVYKNFIFDNDERKNFFTLAKVPKWRDRIIRIYSFSKAFSVTGWRIGYLHTHKDLAQKILATHDSLVTCAPVVSQYAALAALRMPENIWEGYLKEYAQRRSLILEGLDKLKDYLDYVTPPAAYYVFPRLNIKKIQGYKNSRVLALDILNKVGLAVVPGSPFGPTGEDHVRLSFGRSRKDIEQGLKRLANYFNGL